MRKLLLFILIFVGTSYLSLEAQTWCLPGASWYYRVDSLTSSGYRYFQYDADTVIGGIPCKVIDGWQYLTTVGLADTSATILNRIITYASGDTVYVYDTAFHSIYYFGAIGGDTITMPNVGINGIAVVDSNGTLIVGADTLRYYYFHLPGTCANHAASEFKVIDRIGCTGMNLIPAWYCSPNQAGYQLCSFSDSAISGYPDSASACRALPITPAIIYHHLLDSINIWHYTYNTCFEVLSPNNNNQRSLPSCGDPTARGIVWTGADSVFNNLTYKQLNAKQNSSYAYSVADSCYLGLIREDTLAGKVYYIRDSASIETLLYNFAMQPGQSMHFNFMDSTGYPYYQGNYYGALRNGDYILDSITIVNTLLGPRNVYNLSCPSCNNNYNPSWIEGVGCLVDITYPFMENVLNNCSYGFFPGYQHNFSYFIVCFEHSQKVFFDSAAYAYAAEYAAQPWIWTNHWYVTDSCDFAGGWGAIHELTALSSFTCYPNPADDNIALKLEVAREANFDIYVKDIQGRDAVIQLSLGNLGTGTYSRQLSVAGLSQGLYFIECRTSHGSVYNKLVVQR